MHKYNWGKSTPDGGGRQIWRLLGDAAALALALQVGHHAHDVDVNDDYGDDDDNSQEFETVCNWLNNRWRQVQDTNFSEAGGWAMSDVNIVPLITNFKILFTIPKVEIILTKVIFVKNHPRWRCSS